MKTGNALDSSFGLTSKALAQQTAAIHVRELFLAGALKFSGIPGMPCINQPQT